MQRRGCAAGCGPRSTTSVRSTGLVRKSFAPAASTRSRAWVVGVGGEHDDRHELVVRRRVRERLHDLDAVHARHVEVEQDEVRSEPPVEGDHRRGVLRRVHVRDAGLGERPLQEHQVGGWSSTTRTDAPARSRVGVEAGTWASPAADHRRACVTRSGRRRAARAAPGRRAAWSGRRWRPRASSRWIWPGGGVGADDDHRDARGRRVVAQLAAAPRRRGCRAGAGRAGSSVGLVLAGELEAEPALHRGDQLDAGGGVEDPLDEPQVGEVVLDVEDLRPRVVTGSTVAAPPAPAGRWRRSYRSTGPSTTGSSTQKVLPCPTRRRDVERAAHRLGQPPRQRRGRCRCPRRRSARRRAARTA